MLKKLIGIKELYKLLNLCIYQYSDLQAELSTPAENPLGYFIGASTPTDSRRIRRSDPDPLMYTSAGNELR